MTLLTNETFVKLPKENLYQFLNDCVNGLLNENPVEFNTVLSNKIGANKKFEPVRKEIQHFYRQRTIDENFLLPPELSEDIRNAIETVYKIRHDDIINCLVKEKIINNGHNLVETFDWKLKWILGSSKLANVREPMCQVDLSCVNLGKDLKPCKNYVNFECDLEKIDELIKVLSNVKAELGES